MEREYSFSFNNQQLTRKQEFPMKYNICSILKEFILLYQRNGMVLNAEYFKDLVTLFKKATRSSLLYLSFASNRERFDIKDDYIRFKFDKPIDIHTQINFYAKSSKSMGINKQPLFIEYSNRSFIIHTQGLFLRDIDKLNRFDNIIMTGDDNILNDIYTLFLEEKTNITNPFEMLLVKGFRDDILSEFKQSFLERYNYLNINEQTLLSDSDKNQILNAYEQLFLDKYLKETYIQNDNRFLSIYKKAQVNDDDSAFQDSKILNINEVLNAFPNDNKIISALFESELYTKYDLYLNIFDNIHTKHNEILFNLYENFNVSKALVNYTSIFDTLTAKPNSSMYINIYNDKEIFGFPDYKRLNIEQSLLPKKTDNITNIYDQAFLSTNGLILNTFNYYNTSKMLSENSNTFVSCENTFVAKDTYRITNINDTFLIKDELLASYEHNDTYLDKSSSGSPIYLNTDNFYYKDNSLLYSDELFTGILKDKQSLSILYEDAISKIRPKINYYHFDIPSLLRTNNMSITLNKYVQLSRNNIDIFYNKIVSLVDTGRFVRYFDKYIFASRDKKHAYMLKTIDALSKRHNLFNYFDSFQRFYRESKTVGRNNHFFYVLRESKELNSFLDKIFVQKDDYKLYVNKDILGLLKESSFAFDNEPIYDIIKNLMVLEYTNQDHIVISINKINDSAFTDNISEFIYKGYRNTNDFYTEELTASKQKNGLFRDQQLICDKISKSVNFRQFVNYSIAKKTISIKFLNTENNSMLKTHNILRNPLLQNNEFGYKVTKSLYLHIDESALRKYTSITLFESPSFIYKKFTSVDTFNNEWLSVYKLMFLKQEEFSFRQTYIKDVFETQGDYLSIDKHAFTIDKSEYMSIDKYAMTSNALSIIRNNVFNGMYYDNFYLSKEVLTSYFPEIMEIHKIIKEANISTDPIIDWAWVYEEDEEFEDPFKIDELLLPENDTRYEDFENIIFNRDTLKPRNPVKIIDDYTFIAKFPNHYPIKDDDGENAYKNIALEYLDVRTSIMRQVFLGYYKVWQDHIFEFSRMTIPQSAKKILDYLYAWILMYFSEEDIPEALRTFRLVRWYLERSIIECSEYKISYTPDDLTSGKMDTTKLSIPNDLDYEYCIQYMDEPKQNNTMYVDASKHVIRNNPDLLIHEASVTFFIENHKDTTISFDLHSSTPVYIILNGEIIDSIILPITGKMVYNIPYTGEINHFTIKKLAIDNVDNFFFIGNIVLKDMGSNGELEIEFNPKIQGNKVLNHVSQKIFSYMNLYDDNETLIQSLIEGNVHLSDVYEHLLEYWELHHKRKDKGKRLTIKRT